MTNLIHEANAIFANDRFAVKTCGAAIDSITEEQTVCSMAITEDHLNAVGTLMGGAIFTLADFTFAVASNFHKDITVSVDSHISFLGVAKGDKIIARSRCIKEGRNTCFYEIAVSDNLGNAVALVNITGFIKRKA
ncbi:PaaI family thioesterase [[Clostridium] polysaccharolyticum]|uniref:Acyl-CoA thioesterase n=1 Tax=[Clostridium] polysaccharolyticum TaxID=29364 RepID=A0A1I0B961_9FIRM|nr:PaaI family thioesterase [[Clostridium] polysaccharolyticum]SET03080.1 acyl-CoA thioesterase [[Clostridium] polysaccharolyticum]